MKATVGEKYTMNAYPQNQNAALDTKEWRHLVKAHASRYCSRESTIGVGSPIPEFQQQQLSKLQGEDKADSGLLTLWHTGMGSCAKTYPCRVESGPFIRCKEIDFSQIIDSIGSPLR